LTVPQDFSLTSSTASQTVSAGQTTGAYSLTVQPVSTSFTGAVTLACSAGLPTGAQCNFNPSTPVTPGNSAVGVAMSISTSASTSAGTYSVSINGTSGQLSHTATVSLVVTGAVVPNNFQLAVAQAFPSNVDAGSSQQAAQVSITPNYNGSVNASCDASAMPAAQCTLSKTNSIPISAGVASTITVTLNVPSNAAPISYNINVTVTDSSGQPSQTIQLPISVMQDFSLSSATPSQTVTPGQTSGAYQLTIAPNPQGYSFTGAVTLSCSNGLPAGATCLFNPSTPQAPDGSAVSVVMSISTPAISSKISSGHRSVIYAMWFFLPGIGLAWIAAVRISPRRRFHLFGSASLLVLLSLTLVSCAGVSNGGSTSTPPPPSTYTVTITGISGQLSHSATVTLIVE
jgi:hypothetical protein